MAEAENVQKPGVDRLWMVDPGTIGGIIHGPLPNKSNSRQIIMIPRKKGGDPKDKRPLVIKSAEAREYEVRFEEAVWRNLRDLGHLPDEARLYLNVVVHQQDLRRDLDCELLPDLLQKFNIIKNDRAIWRKEYVRELDRDCPRIVFRIGVLSDTASADLFHGAAG